MDYKNGPGFFYDDEKIEELEKKVSTLTQQLQELLSRSEQQQATITSLESESLLQQVQGLKDHIDELRHQLKEKLEAIKSLQKRVQELEAQIHGQIEM